MTTKLSETEKTLRKLEKISGGPLTLGKLLWAIRKGEEMTQSEFASVLGVSTQYVCDLENRRRFASPSAAADYANKLGYSAAQFVELCLQDILNRENLPFIIHIKNAA